VEASERAEIMKLSTVVAAALVLTNMGHVWAGNVLTFKDGSTTGTSFIAAVTLGMLISP